MKIDYINQFKNIINNNIITTGGLAWDWVNEKIYWTDACGGKIEVYDQQTGYRKTLVSTVPGSYPRAIVLDPTSM